MLVGVVVQNEFPNDRDIRAQKLVEELTRRGHNTVVFCPRSKDAQGMEEPVTDRGTCLHRLPLRASPLNLLWSVWIGRDCRRHKIDVLVASGLPVALPTIFAGWISRRPVVLDLFENYPEAVRVRKKERPVHYVTRNSILVKILEWVCVHLADHIWVVVEERAMEWIKRGVRPEKITILSNVPILGKEMALHRKQAGSKGSFTIVYFGIIEPMRGIERILRALPHVVARRREVQFLIVGDGSDVRRLTELTRLLQIEEHVRFLGWIGRKDIADIMEAADLGVIPHDVNAFTNSTIPNKLFDYMAHAIPVLATDMKPVRKILESERCGIVVPKDCSDLEIAECLLDLMDRRNLLLEMGERGRRAIMRKYNWHVAFDEAMQSLEFLTDRQ